MLEVFASFVEVDGNLQVHPKLRRCLQLTGKEDGGLRRHVALPVDERIDPLNGHTHPVSQLNLTEFHWAEKFLKQNLPRVGRLAVFGYHRDLLLMVVDIADIFSIPVSPVEYDPVLVVYSDAVPTPPVAFEDLETVAGRYFQVLNLVGRVNHVQLSGCDFPKCPRNGSSGLGVSAVVDVFSCPVPKVQDHASNVTFSRITCKQVYSPLRHRHLTSVLPASNQKLSDVPAVQTKRFR